MYYFILNREQIHRILACGLIRTDGDAFLLKERLCTVNRLMQRVASQVVRVVYEMCGVVALELQHELQVIAEVVLAQTKAMRQVALIVSSGYTADEAHFRLVVEAYTVQGLRQCKSLAAAFDTQDAIAFERMPGFEDLQFVQLPFGDG